VQRSLRASLHSLEPILHLRASGGDGRERAPLDAVCEIVDVFLRSTKLPCSHAGDFVEGGLRLPGSLDDQRLNAGDHLARRVEPLMRHLVEDGAVALVADAG
jgi:hypothetical protein